MHFRRLGATFARSWHRASRRHPCPCSLDRCLSHVWCRPRRARSGVGSATRTRARCCRSHGVFRIRRRVACRCGPTTGMWSQAVTAAMQHRNMKGCWHRQHRARTSREHRVCIARYIINILRVGRPAESVSGSSTMVWEPELVPLPKTTPHLTQERQSFRLSTAAPAATTSIASSRRFNSSPVGTLICSP